MLPTILVLMKSGAQLERATKSRYQPRKATVHGKTKAR